MKKVKMGEEEIFEIIIKDAFGRKLDRWVFMKSDFGNIARMLSNKYSLGLWINDKHQKKPDSDLDWAK